MKKQDDLKAVERAQKEWEQMEQEVEQEAHDLVKNTPSRADEEEGKDRK